jgi:hypothetical protein
LFSRRKNANSSKKTRSNLLDGVTHEENIMLNEPSRALPSQEYLARLAIDDPQAFEELRSELIERCINRAPERMQARLRGIQFRVDCIRRLSRSPLGALIKIQAMMWESFLRMDQELQGFARRTDTPYRRATSQRDRGGARHGDAVVIELRSRMPIGAG